MSDLKRLKQKSATIVDVAKEAGVSPRTVSRFMNNNGYVNPQTAESIRSAVEKLGYRPNRAARSLVSSESRMIGLVIPDINNLFFPEVVLGIERAAMARDYTVITFSTSLSSDKEDEAYRFLNEHRADGIIVYFPALLTQEKLADVLHYQRAAVLVDADSTKFESAGHIHVDFYDAAWQAVEHMVAVGRRNLGYIVRQQTDFLTFQERRRGLLDAAEEFGATITISEYKSDEQKLVDDGNIATQRLLAEKPDIDGLVCFNDMIAYGAMEACDHLNLSIPEQIAIIGVDDLRISSFPRISLTTLRIPKFEIATQAIDLLFDRLQGNETTQQVLVKTQLIQRGSTPHLPSKA